MPKFRFEVDLGDNLKDIAFQEVSGMDTESQVIEYHTSSSPIKGPVIHKYGNVTLKRGIFANDPAFWRWHSQIVMNTIERRTVIIRLLNEEGKVNMKWELLNAWPTKITSTDMKSDGNEVAVDALEIAHEGIRVLRDK